MRCAGKNNERAMVIWFCLLVVSCLDSMAVAADFVDEGWHYCRVEAMLDIRWTTARGAMKDGG